MSAENDKAREETLNAAETMDLSEFGASTLEQEAKEKRIPEEYAMAIVFAFLLFFGGINVVLRYVFNTQIPYVNDMMVDVFVWLTLIGMPIACYRGANMSFRMIYDKANPFVQRILIIFNALLAIGLFAFIGYVGTKSFLNQLAHGYKTAVPFIPKSFWSAAFPVCTALYIFRTIQATVKDLKALNMEKEDKK